MTEDERQAVLEATLQPDYADLPPGRIVPRLADQGGYPALRIDVLSRAAGP